MKNLATLIIYTASLSLAFSQCNEFYQLAEGSEWEMENYDAKGKKQGRNTQKVINFESQSASFKATVHSTVFDKKDNEVSQGDIEFTCENGIITIDMRNFINQEQMKAFQNYEMKVEAENLEIPNSLSVGQTLKDGKVTLTTSNSPLPMMMTVTISDRKVIGKESITTPAGTFDCFKISSTLNVNTKIGIAMTIEMSSFDWLAPKVGTVKSESYRKNKLQGYSLLTKRN
jgi:hypothetical protein